MQRFSFAIPIRIWKFQRNIFTTSSKTIPSTWRKIASFKSSYSILPPHNRRKDWSRSPIFLGRANSFSIDTRRGKKILDWETHFLDGACFYDKLLICLTKLCSAATVIFARTQNFFFSILNHWKWLKVGGPVCVDKCRVSYIHFKRRKRVLPTFRKSPLI